MDFVVGERNTFGVVMTGFILSDLLTFVSSMK